MNWPFGDIMPLSADVMVIDFPWDFELYSEAGAEKSASAQYETMAHAEIIEFAKIIGHLASGDCLVLLWGCEWIPLSARQAVLEAIGSIYKTTIVWRKTTRKGKVRMGPGYRARTMHEPIHLATIGNPKHKAFPSIFDGIARQHSRKPEEFYELVEKLTPSARRLDLFSRASRKGWTNWGFEKEKFDVDQPASLKRDRPAPEPKALEPMTLFPDAA